MALSSRLDWSLDATEAGQLITLAVALVSAHKQPLYLSPLDLQAIDQSKELSPKCQRYAGERCYSDSAFFVAEGYPSADGRSLSQHACTHQFAGDSCRGSLSREEKKHTAILAQMERTETGPGPVSKASHSEMPMLKLSHDGASSPPKWLKQDRLNT